MKHKFLKLCIVSAVLSTSSVYAETKKDSGTISKWLSTIAALFSSTTTTNQNIPNNQQVYVQPQNFPQVIVPYNNSTPTLASANATLNNDAYSTMPIYQSKNPTEMTEGYQAGTNSSYRWPVSETVNGNKNTVVSPWGPRCGDIHPDGNQNCGSGEAGSVQMHNGIDINVPTGTQISSVNDGKVVWVDPYCQNQSGKAPAGGCSVSVMNEQGEMFTYMHLSSVPDNLKSGSTINAGDNIGASGNTGRSEGAHLHLGACEVQADKVTGTENPTKYCRPENGGKAVNPLDKLDPSDNRAKDARKLEALRNEYHKCLKNARAAGDTKTAAECKKAWQARKSMPKTEQKDTMPDTRQSKAIF